DEHRDLLAVLHRLERGAQGDLGLAVADVTDDEPVHRPSALHVAFRILDRLQLVGRLGEREGVLHLDLPRRVLAERVRVHHLARGVELDELAGDLFDGLLRLALRRRPLATAERRERWWCAADVARDPVNTLGRQRDDVRSGEARTCSCGDARTSRSASSSESRAACGVAMMRVSVPDPATSRRNVSRRLAYDVTPAQPSRTESVAGRTRTLPRAAAARSRAS